MEITMEYYKKYFKCEIIVLGHIMLKFHSKNSCAVYLTSRLIEFYF